MDFQNGFMVRIPKTHEFLSFFLDGRKVLICFCYIYTGPDLPYDLRYINQAIVTSPDGGGIIIVGGHNWQSDSNENQIRILESRFTGSEFLPWQLMDQKLNQGRENHVVIPIPKSVTTKCN